MDIETLACSKLRREAIIRLLDGPGRLSDIAPGTSSVNSSRAMRPLVADGLVETGGGLAVCAFGPRSQAEGYPWHQELNSGRSMYHLLCGPARRWLFPHIPHHFNQYHLI